MAIPYGKPAADALDFMLHQLEELGMTCTNYEYHMGAADWDASLPQHLGILCHLDVVPAVPSNWKSDPFTAEIRDGRIYGRGAIDDKGPAVAVLYALRAIRESGIPLRKNVRFLLGCNEENGSTDLEYYMARHAMPPQVFTPDGSYPIIHQEKGMLRLQFTKATADPIARFSAGTAPNAVPADAAVSLSAAFCGTAEQGSQITRQGNELAYKGIAAHASTPESGDNAITGLLTYLGSDSAFADCRALAELFPHGCTDGSGLGIACADTESGALTCICSMLHVENGTLTGCVDIRFPVCTTKETVLEQVQAAFAAKGIPVRGADSERSAPYPRKIPRLYRTCWRSTRSRPVHRASALPSAAAPMCMTFPAAWRSAWNTPAGITICTETTSSCRWNSWRKTPG